MSGFSAAARQQSWHHQAQLHFLSSLLLPFPSACSVLSGLRRGMGVAERLIKTISCSSCNEALTQDESGTVRPLQPYPRIPSRWEVTGPAEITRRTLYSSLPSCSGALFTLLGDRTRPCWERVTCICSEPRCSNPCITRRALLGALRALVFCGFSHSRSRSL